jgi:hypothetical protein
MFAENLAQFFDTDDHGVAVVLKRGATVLRTINAIFNSPAQEVAIYDRSFYDEKFYSSQVAVNSPQLQCRTVDVSDLRANDTATIGSDVYYIMYHEPDGTGVSNVFLSLNQV